MFLLAAAQLWFTWRGPLAPSLLAIPLLIFIALVATQSRLERRAECVKRATLYYRRALTRLNNTWQGSGEAGDRFIDPHHPYSLDLDLFGRGSLFELLSTSRTRAGEACLAEWLLHPASKDEVLARQHAIEELRPMLDWREQLFILSTDYRAGVHPEALQTWAAAPKQSFSVVMRSTAFVLSLFALTAIVWWFATNFVGLESRFTLVGIGVVQGLFALSLRRHIQAIVSAIDEPAADLALLSDILASIESQEFQSPLLRRLRSEIDLSGTVASTRIARLRRWKELLDSRDNVVLRVFGPLLLWTTQISMALENWRVENGAHIPRWLKAIGEIEALSSFANYAFENPEDPYPSICDATAHFEGENLAHPLLPRARAVSNTVRLRPPLRLYIVSGSNMSGKSTLLRSVGINAVLALAGAPVRATSMSLSSLSLGASIRTTDSLEEGHSRFMAEILRLKQILELPSPALFLLDELLHGTNSHDRAIGSEGLIHALMERHALGFITTHDLSLSRIADQIAPVAQNVHFEDRLEDGKLLFDYQMREGVVARSNALDLMRAVGLDV